MSKTIELPSGAYVEIRDVDSYRKRDRDRIIKDAYADGDPSDVAVALSTADAMCRSMILSWSFESPVPSVQRDALDDLTIADVDALYIEALEMRAVVFPDFDPTPDPASPTRPAGV